MTADIGRRNARAFAAAHPGPHARLAAHPGPHAGLPGHRFAAGAHHGRALVAVVLAGPSAQRRCNDGRTLESVVAARDARFALPALLAHIRRTARAMGHRRLVTRLGGDLAAAALCAAGWRRHPAHRGQAGGQSRYLPGPATPGAGQMPLPGRNGSGDQPYDQQVGPR